jgi:hypothetical protein
MRAFVVASMVTCVFAAGAARAQVAIAATITDGNVVQRQIAGALVTAVSERWQTLPPFTAKEIARCQAGDTGCLRRLAREQNASHLLIVGMAPIGFRDVIVAVQLFDISADRALFEESIVQPGGDLAKLEETHLLAARLLNTKGPPAGQRKQRGVAIDVKYRDEVVLDFKEGAPPASSGDVGPLPLVVSSVAIVAGLAEMIGATIWLGVVHFLSYDFVRAELRQTDPRAVPGKGEPDPGGQDWDEGKSTGYGPPGGRALALKAHRHNQYWQYRGGTVGALLMVAGGATSAIAGAAGVATWLPEPTE